MAGFPVFPGHLSASLVHRSMLCSVSSSIKSNLRRRDRPSIDLQLLPLSGKQPGDVTTEIYEVYFSSISLSLFCSSTRSASFPGCVDEVSGRFVLLLSF